MAYTTPKGVRPPQRDETPPAPAPAAVPPDPSAPSAADGAPVTAFRYRGGVSAAIFRRQRTGQDGRSWASYSVSLRRSYFDPAKKEWQHPQSLRPEDLPVAILALQQAFEFLVSRESEDAGE